MATDYASYQRLLDYRIPDIEHTRSVRDTILYALGVGLGADPVDRKQLRYVYEKDLLALPTMILAICSPHAWVAKSGTGFGAKSVTSDQSFKLHKQVPVQGEFHGEARLVSAIDKGPGKGALFTVVRELYNKTTGDLVATLEATTFCRGDGGFGGPTGRGKAPHALPKSKPQFVCDLATLPQAALIYRLSGDYNPLHVDPEHATSVGFPRPNLHGLCTMGVAGHALLRTLCDYDPSPLRGMEARFSAPVYPGDTLRTEIWKDGPVVSFRTVVPERDNAVVLDNGRAEILF